MSEIACMEKDETKERTIYRCSVCGEVVGYISKLKTSVGLCEHLSDSLTRPFEDREEAYADTKI